MRDFRSLAIFAEVVRFGTLTSAARSLGMSVSAVSKTVSKLEQGLGTRLINRNTRNLRLTSDGEILYEALSRGLDRIEAAHALVGSASEEPAGEVRISLPNAYGRACFLPSLAEFRERYPGITIEVSLDDRSVDLIQNGFDVGIRHERLRDSRYVARHLNSCPVVLVASPAYVARAGVPRQPAELARHDIVKAQDCDGQLAVWHLRNAAKGKHCRIDQVGGKLVISHQTSGCIDMAVAGLGIAALPWFGVITHLEAGRLAVVLPNWELGGEAETPDSEIVLVYPEKDFLPLRSRVTIDFLVDANRRFFARAFDPHSYAAKGGSTVPQSR